MYCENCGYQVSPTSKFCPNCGEKLKKEAQEIQAQLSCIENTTQDGQKNTPTPQISYEPEKDYETYVGYNLLSFLFPIVGLILSIVFRKNRPAQASCCKSNMILGFIICGISALISAIALTGGF